MVNRRSGCLNPTGDADIPAPPPASSSSSSSSDAQAHKVPPVPEPDFAVQGGSEGGLDGDKKIGREDGVGSREGDQGREKEERVAAGQETGKRGGRKRARSPDAATGSPETYAVVYADEAEDNKNGGTVLALQFPPASLSPEDSLQSFLSSLIRHITWRLLPSRSPNQTPIIGALRTALLSVSAKEGSLSLPLSLPRDRAHGCSEGGHESVPVFQHSHKQRQRRRPVWEAQQVAARNSVDVVMGGEGLGSCEGDPERVVFLSRKAWRLAAPLYDSGWGAGTFLLQRLFGTTSEEGCGDCGFVWSRKDRERMITCEGGCRRPFHRSCVGLPPPASASSTYLKELRGDETVQKARAMRRRRRAKLRARLQRQEQKMAEAAAASEEFDPDCVDGLDDSDEEEEGEETAVLSERLSKRQAIEEEKEEEEGDEGNEDEQGEKEEGWAYRWCRRGLVRCSHCRQYSPREEVRECVGECVLCWRTFHPLCVPLGSAFVIPGGAVVCAHHLVMRDLRRSVEQMKKTEELRGGTEGVPASAKEEVKSLEDQAKQKAQEEGYDMKNKDSTAPSASEGEGARKKKERKRRERRKRRMLRTVSPLPLLLLPLVPRSWKRNWMLPLVFVRRLLVLVILTPSWLGGRLGSDRSGWVLPPTCRRAWLKSTGGKRDVALAEVLRSRVLLEDSGFDVCVEWAEAAERESRDGEKLLARRRVKAEREILAIETAEREEIEERRRRKDAQREKEERAGLRAEQGGEEDGSDEEEEKEEEGRGRKPVRILGRDEFRKEFQFITRHLWKAKREKKSADDLADDLCRCDGKCEMDKCANALIFMECGMRNCSNPNECENRRFSKQKYKDVHVRECGDKGKGLFAAEAIQGLLEQLNKDQYKPNKLKRKIQDSSANADGWKTKTI
uniref:AWS domain-containing protein n=1 Tax=Chromera velia CCMP2878 TaxID=1169474 RepID=A0A0G4I550_9ALVE|eukprot:Cvel_11089.t1-p1 / transcript=Cvel_11089.t1 / gene=Cvel_11089 / organism=Chromera_velia_CCMP2878 / gene_product=hypothetical protein / transcript_product=hypothetical protein / location=Cvel_scaffold686:29598-35946(+) / protein_length=901 / sequence_SO=supercontig / SO=protein_coding / is_pseudo=false